jgi:RNA polymerase sigma-70 factor, ECF subfamily
MYPPGSLGGGRLVLVNGDLGIHLSSVHIDGYRKLDEHVSTFAIRDGRIETIYDMANPDKLTRVPEA